MSNRVVHSCKLNELVYGVEHQALVQYDSEYQEYAVRFFVNGTTNHDATYYTDDKQDAISTARKALFDLGKGQVAVVTVYGDQPGT